MARRRLSRSYKRRRLRKALLVLGLIVVTVLITTLLIRCSEEHATLVPQLQLPEGSGDD